MNMEEASRRKRPSLPGNGGGGGSIIRRMRKPLSDCTNTARKSSQSSSSSSASVLKPQPKSDFSIPKSNLQPSNKISKVEARNPSSATVDHAPNAPSLPRLKSSSASGQGQSQLFDPYIASAWQQAGQKMKTKAKADVVPMGIEIRVSRDKLNQDTERSISKLHAPKKRKQHSKHEKNNPKKALEDYIQQQRSYYAEIDAFELPEEEVDSIAALE